MHWFIFQDEKLAMQELEVEAIERRKQEMIEEYITKLERHNDFHKFHDQKDTETEEMAKQMIKMNVQL